MRIAVAHGDDQVRRLVTTSLRQDGHCVVPLGSSEELVGCLSSWTLRGARADLLVLGDDLGGRSGAQIAAAIRDTAWDAPVVLVIDGMSPDPRGDPSAADAVFTTPFDTDDMRTVALCLRRSDDDAAPGAPIPSEPLGLRLELAFRGVPFLDELVYFARNRSARLEASTGVRGRCALRVHAAWKRACRVYVTEMEVETAGGRTMRLVRSDLDLFRVIGSAFDAVERALTASPDEAHDGWQPVRRRQTPARVEARNRWSEDTTEQLTLA